MPQGSKRHRETPKMEHKLSSQKKSKCYIISQLIVEGMHKTHNRELVS